MIRHTPATARTEMPFPFKSDFFCKVQCHLNRRDQGLGITEVRALMEMNAFKGKMILLTKCCGSQYLCARHAEFAIVLPGLCVSVMGCDGDTGQETEPEFYVTLSPSASLRIISTKGLAAAWRDSSLAMLPQNYMEMM